MEGDDQPRCGEDDQSTEADVTAIGRSGSGHGGNVSLFRDLDSLLGRKISLFR